MSKNNLIKTKPISKEGLIYALIFVSYAVVLVLVFVYSVKFLNQALKTAISSPVGSEIENKYAQLDLENYSLLANKLNLSLSSGNQLIINQPIQNITPEATTSSEIVIPEMIASSSQTSTIEITPTTTAPIVTQPTTSEIIAQEVVQAKPSIIVINSTLKSGLAANLKSELNKSGYAVLRTASSKPALDNTIIKIKSSVNQNSQYLMEIKKIVSLNYDFTLETLDEKADHDLEIIIGNK
jgi:hypothetical protein